MYEEIAENDFQRREIQTGPISGRICTSGGRCLIVYVRGGAVCFTRAGDTGG